MAYLTDQEQLERFEYYTLQLEEELLRSDDFDTVINSVPFCICLNDPNTFELLHVNNGHAEISGFSREEVREKWEEYIQIVHPYSVSSILKFLPEFYKSGNSNQTITFVQYVKCKQDTDFSPYITFSKPSRLPGDLKLWLTVSPSEFDKYSSRMKRIIKMDEFKLKHFKKFQRLTAREIEILKLLANGHNNPQIADKLYLSRSTVETHRKNLKRKLELKNLRDLMRYAFAFNLVEL